MNTDATAREHPFVSPTPDGSAGSVNEEETTAKAPGDAAPATAEQPLPLRLARVLLLGGLAGALATIPMSVVVYLGRRAGFLPEPPPKQITARAESRTGLRRHLRGSAFEASWLVAHVGYGALRGALYALISRWLPAPPPITGLLYGLMVWADSYLAVLPRLGLFPSPNHDRPERQATIIVAHLVYGGVLGSLFARLQGRG